jgi:hypothetical protein
MAVLGPVVYQQENSGSGNAFAQQTEKCLRLGTEPVQIFKDYDQRLIEAFAQQQPFDRVENASSSDLWVHLL